MKAERRVALIGGAAVVAALGLLRRFPPERFSFYPACPVFAYLHLLCPGCGATRALAALIGGHVAEALRWNALFVILLPLFAAYAGSCLYRAWTAETFRWPEPPAWTLPALIAITLTFTAARNVLS